jgi:pantoate--beta-alanine ligase
MDLIRSARELRASCDDVRRSDRTVGFVPTMGFFHDGHLSLMRAAREERDHVVVSIFVNPLQFGPAEDYASYPRDLDRDLQLAEEQGVDLAFAPDVDEMYPHGPPEATVDPGPLASVLEGAARPGHFRGVCTVLSRLFHLAGESRAYFGQKDAQQVAVVRRMVRDLAFPIEAVACPTLREPDGLAMSSRNIYLSAEERRAALALSQALQAAAEAVEYGERSSGAILRAMRERIAQEPLASLDYVAVVDDDTFREMEELAGPARALVAARIGRARLIDNTALPVMEN